MTVIFCDTDSELSYSTMRELGYNIIKMPYVFLGEEAFPEEDTDMPAFFDAMRKGEVPTTAALNTQNYLDYFTPFFEKGEDILYVAFGSAFSQTFNAMNIAVVELKQKYPNVRFEIFDTKCISMASGLQVYAAGLMFRQGKSIDEILAALKELEPHANAVVAVDDLKYLKRGGRVSAFAATFGTILNIKPILMIPENGVLEPREKIKGRKQSIQFIADNVIANAQYLEEYPIVVLHADCQDDCALLVSKIKAELSTANVWVYEIGPVIGAHCGPGTIAACYFGTKRLPAKK